MVEDGMVPGVVLAVLFGLVISLVPGSSKAQTSPWPTFQQNPQRTGLSRYNGPPSSDLRWDYTTAGGVWSSPAIGTDGTVYFGSGQWLWALNQDGSLKWDCAVGEIWSSSPAIGDDGTVYIGCENGLYAIEDSITYGKLKWTYPTIEINAPVLVGTDGAIYAVADELYAVDPGGSLKWTYHIGISSSLGGPALSLDGTTVYVQHATAFDYYLGAVDTSGTVEWECRIGSAPFNFSESTPAVGSDSTIYFPLFDGGDLVAITPGGNIKWGCSDIGPVRYSSPAVGPGDTIYVGSIDNSLYAVNPDGTFKWSYSTGAPIYSSPAVDVSGTIYVGSNDSLLHAVNPDGSQKWTYNTHGRVHSSPAIDTTEAVYIGSWDNSKLHAIGEPLGVEEGANDRLPMTRFQLLQNYPNPFSHTTTIHYAVPPRQGDAATRRGGGGAQGSRGAEEQGSHLSTYQRINLSIYDLSGRIVRTLVDEWKAPGYRAVSWDGRDESGQEVRAGVYFCRVQARIGQAGGFSSTKKMVVLRRD